MIHANATSPATQQMLGLEDFTDDEFRTVLSFNSFVPCPIDLYPLIVHVTRLRVAVATKQPLSEISLELKVQAIFNATWRFDFKTCAAKPSRLSTEIRQSIGEIFVVTIRLYGILTLPPSATAAWAVSSTQIRAAYPPLPGRSMADTLRIQHRDEILTKIKQIWGELQYKTAIALPLAVVGVAAAGDALEDQRFIEQCLEDILALPNTTCPFLITIDKLRQFWRSGKTGWEDCWDEPVVCTG